MSKIFKLVEPRGEEAETVSQDTKHHDQSASVQTTFLTDVQPMIKVMEDFENPFEEDSQDLLVLDTKEIAPPEAVDGLRRAHKVGQVKFDNFVRERLVERMKPMEDAIHRNKLKIFGQPTKLQAKGKQQMKSLKNDVDLFSRLYFRCQNWDLNLDEFFQHENQACPPALSDVGGIHLDVKTEE